MKKRQIMMKESEKKKTSPTCNYCKIIVSCNTRANDTSFIIGRGEQFSLFKPDRNPDNPYPN